MKIYDMIYVVVRGIVELLEIDSSVVATEKNEFAC